MQYASALPDLVKDNIGDAPLTVGLLLKKLGLVYSEYSSGMDINITEDYPDGGRPPLSETYLEIPR